MVSTELCPFSTLALNSLRLTVRLGCSAEERQVPQYVRFDLQVRFSSLPQGCFTDNLGDTICYAQLSEQIKRICQLQEYQLIEKLGWDAFAAVKEILPQDTKLWLRLVKEKPPVENLEGGSSFTLADWAE